MFVVWGHHRVKGYVNGMGRGMVGCVDRKARKKERLNSFVGTWFADAL